MWAATDLDIQSVCTDLKNGGVGDICIADMIRMAGADSIYQEEEKRCLQQFAEKLGVGDNALRTLEKFIFGGIALESDSAIFLKEKFPAAGLDPERFSYLQESYDDPGSAKALHKELPGKPQRTEGDAGAKLRLEFVKNAQREILSQIEEQKKYLWGLRDVCKEKALKEGLKKSADRLEEEGKKVKDLRLTLAFIGTMKSGKSTTINAIAGADILPSRSGAMTTLPTLVTHAEGQIEPRLVFRKPQPFTDALQQIREISRNEKKDTKGELYEEALGRIISGKISGISSEYTGESAINDFMVTINDISRICAGFNLESPLDQYSSIEDFPEIEVEFSYLRDRVKGSVGKLSVIDTPGPNEAGQGHLKGIVKTQLANASAIVCVADPFQADSEAQEELRQWIADARLKNGVQLFVLWNKLDLLNREERKKSVADWEAKAKNLFPDILRENKERLTISKKTFAISSRQGLLANMANRTIESAGSFPSVDKNEWVASFMEAAYGTYWDDDPDCLADVELHKKSSDRMWKLSRMAEPLERIVAAGLDHAAPLCFESALRKVRETLTNVKEKSIQIPLKSIDADLARLQDIIRLMEINLQKISAFENDSHVIRKEVLEDVNREISNLMDELKEKALDVIKDMSKEKHLEMEKAEKVSKEKVFDWRRPFWKKDKDEDVKKVFSSDDPIKFYAEDKAKEFAQAVMTEVSSALKASMQESVKRLEKPVQEAQARLSELMDEKIRSIIMEIDEKLFDSFGMKLSVPDMSISAPSLDMDIIESDLVESKRRRGTYTERRWYTFWLYEHEVHYTTTDYFVKPKQIRDEIKKAIENSIEKTRGDVEEFIETNFKHNIDKYLEKLRSEMVQVRFTVEEGILLNQSDANEKASSKEKLLDFKDKFEGLSNRQEKVEKMIKSELGENEKCMTPI